MLDSTDLRNDIVALLRANRELPPGHEDALADSFLERVEFHLPPQVRPAPHRGIHPLLATCAVALAAVVSPFLARAALNPSATAHPLSGRDGFFGRVHDRNGSPFFPAFGEPRNAFPASGDGAPHTHPPLP